MMVRANLFFITIGLASPLFAQATRTDYGLSNGNVQRRGDAYQLHARVVADLGTDRREDGAARKECLDHKRTGKTICLTREEWAAVAAGKRAAPR